MYLEDVLASGSITKGERFNKVEKIWVQLVQTGQANPNLLNLVAQNNPIKQQLGQLLNEIEQC